MSDWTMYVSNRGSGYRRGGGMVNSYHGPSRIEFDLRERVFWTEDGWTTRGLLG